MSVIYTVTVMCHPMERTCLARLNEALGPATDGFGPAPEFERIDQHFGGDKNAEHAVFGAGVNYLDADKFIARFCKLKWEEPKGVVLVIQREDAPARIVFASTDLEMQEQDRFNRRWI